jgi:hypothetical protein
MLSVRDVIPGQVRMLQSLCMARATTLWHAYKPDARKQRFFFPVGCLPFGLQADILIRVTADMMSVARIINRTWQHRVAVTAGQNQRPRGASGTR